MSKFDIVGFLAENKLTESGRKERVHFGETELSRVGMKLLNEMQIKADPDAESLPMEEWDSDDLMGDQENEMDFIDDNPDVNIEEAGYTDDDDDFGIDDEFDFSAGDSMVNRLAGGDKRAKKAFDKTNDVDFDEPETPEFSDSADDDEFEEPEQMSDKPNANAQPGLSSQLKYDPQQVEFDMDDEELDDFLNGFRRPQVAVKVLQRALDQAKAEMEDSLAVKKFYLVLDNGFYKTSAFRKGNVIATIRKKA